MRRARGVAGHDLRVFLLALAAGAPAIVVALALLFGGDHAPKTKWTLALAVVGVWLGFALRARGEVVRPLQTISNLLEAIRHGDFSVRARRGDAGEALGSAFAEVNAIGDVLRKERLGAVEADTLLAKVMLEIDVAVLAFDAAGSLRLANRAAERLLGRNAGQLAGATAATVGVAPLLAGEAVRTVDMEFPGGPGPWQLRRTSFRQHGFPHQLIVLTDLRRALRAEERQAWQRLVRVLGHEINNSLTPIHSIAGNLRAVAARPDRAPDWQEDLGRGLEVIERRADALGRFMSAYARLARLPPPRVSRVDVRAWVNRVAALEQRKPVRVAAGPPLVLAGDPDQLDQLLINLVRNAVDAALETGGEASVTWQRRPHSLEVIVTDEGPGIAQASHLFVPFFTTKPGGSGIGLALSRQIAEAHDGTLELVNRTDASGCLAVLRLPA